jgi:hypothetical protein
MKTKTINLQGKEYAQVQDRLIAFRTENPNGLIETTPTIQPDGQILFKARILKDKENPASAEASGHALGTSKGQKAFEKLETIAVGRALALLGYASSGEIASSEEMEEFEAYKKQQHEELILESTEKLTDCRSLDELKTAWADLPVEAKTALESVKEDMKKKLSQAVKPKAKKEAEVKSDSPLGV